MSRTTEEIIRACESLPLEKQAEVAGFARWVLARLKPRGSRVWLDDLETSALKLTRASYFLRVHQTGLRHKPACDLPPSTNSKTIATMKVGRIDKDGEVIELPPLTAVIQKDERWYVSTCPELGVASQGKTRKEAYSMLAEAVELWLEAARAKEIKRRLKMGGSVQPLELAHA